MHLHPNIATWNGNEHRMIKRSGTTPEAIKQQFLSITEGDCTMHGFRWGRKDRHQMSERCILKVVAIPPNRLVDEWFGVLVTPLQGGPQIEIGQQVCFAWSHILKHYPYKLIWPYLRYLKNGKLPVDALPSKAEKQLLLPPPKPA